MNIGVQLSSNAEKLAEEAEGLKAFGGLKLLHVKRQIASIVSFIGREGIFDEYTKHDISHIDYMLSSLDWIIPEETKKIMTYSDWLMITLSIYFHDLGMLVTKEEFKNRETSVFPSFKKEIEEGERFGLDYRDKIFNIEDETDRDRFIYQELVRKNHAERIKYWILDEVNPKFLQELSIVTEIKRLMSNLDPLFRRDLALICESHHLSDLEDFDKYKPNQQYGTVSQEKVNLHYSALLLRTADLLHVTSDRTPSIEYNLISPNDPISQEEWAKQRAVKIIRPQAKMNEEGVVDDSIPKDTFEITAYFEDEKGFFGLISYLNYANRLLKENYKSNELSKKTFGTKFDYPWKNIDDSGIETKDFDKRQLEFVLDQTKILDLLVGHTLYNDSSVVLRELIQNGIDAVRLKEYELLDSCKKNYNPEVQVFWNDKDKELSFMDNGTGMTLDIIENHLLKVGSSRYQDETFKKQYPDFSPISRFGIGLLTCFLIADNVDITTRSSDLDKAILIKIRKVHGKYLLKYLTVDKLPVEIKDHGTLVKLYVRADIDLNNIENELKRWILFPKCKVVFKNNKKSIEIGFKSPKYLLKNFLQEKGIEVDDKKIKIEEVSRNGITLAYALKYVEYWNEWEYLDYDSPLQMNMDPIGICIEGIRVDFNSPGFNGRKLLAVADTSGKSAPKTNVARSNIEITSERGNMLYVIYQLYLKHISNELLNLRDIGFSLTWAADEISWMLRYFENNLYREKEIRIEDQSSFDKAISEIQYLLIETADGRDLLSFNKLKEYNHFWTIDCASYSSANSLIKEIKSSNSSVLQLFKTLFVKDSKTDHIDILFCNKISNNSLGSLIKKEFQVSSIKIIPEQRRLDLKWTIKDNNIWDVIYLEEDRQIFDSPYNGKSVFTCYVQLLDLEGNSNIDQVAISSFDALYVLKGSPLNEYLVELMNKLRYPEITTENEYVLSRIVRLLNGFFSFKEKDKMKIEEYIDRVLPRNNHRNLKDIIWSRVDRDELISKILEIDFTIYDMRIWYNRQNVL